MQISNFEYLMQLNTLAGRSYNDITQVIFLISLLLSIIKVFYPIFTLLLILSLFIFGSIPFSLGFFLIIVQRTWIFLILLLTGTFQRLSWMLLWWVQCKIFFIFFKLLMLLIWCSLLEHWTQIVCKNFKRDTLALMTLSSLSSTMDHTTQVQEQ